MDWIDVRNERPCVGEKYKYMFLDEEENIFLGYVKRINMRNRVLCMDTEKKTNKVAKKWILVEEAREEEKV